MATAKLPKVLYNFNENDTTTIRDYSENGNDGTGSSLTTQASARVGYDMVFNANNDRIELNATPLNGKTSAAIHMAVTFSASSGTKEVFSQASSFTCDYNYTTNVLTFNLIVATGTATVSTGTLSLSTFYDFSFVYASNILTLYQDGVSVATDDTESGAIADSASNLRIGKDGGQAARMEVNEFKLYDVSISTANIDAFIAEQNGVLSSSLTNGEFAVGDILVSEYHISPYYYIVTWVGTDFDFRIQPLTVLARGSSDVNRVGHLWDTTRQWSFLIDDAPRITFYDNVSLSTEVFTDAKKTYEINQYGAILPSTTKTANYTATNSDAIIYVDSSGGTFTITLPASPQTNKVIEIIDSTGDCGTNNVTVDGNGKNIVGSATALMADNYTGFRLIYNGTQWNLN